jgi:hypothetical protein
MEKTLMQGEATLTLFAETQNVERFKNLLSKHTIIDCSLEVLTCEGEVIKISVMELLQLDWKETDVEILV